MSRRPKKTEKMNVSDHADVVLKLDYTRRARVARRVYCVETSQISLADATLSDVRSHDELRPESDGNGQVGHPDCLP